MRLIIILRKAQAAQANAALAEATGKPGAAQTFVNPLVRNGNEVAYWCSWNFKGRTYTPQQVLNRLRTTLRLTSDEVLVRSDLQGQVDLTQVKMVAFNADRVEPDAVLAYLGLERHPVVEPPDQPSDPSYVPLDVSPEDWLRR